MKKILFGGLAALALLLLVPAVWVFLSLRDLPDVSVLKHYRPAAASEVLDRNGSPLEHYYERKFRVWVPIASLPDSVIQAVETAEDDTFFGHKGVNYKAVWEALQHDMQKKRFARGGSTITQQVAKNVFFTTRKSITRKLRELVVGGSRTLGQTVYFDGREAPVADVESDVETVGPVLARLHVSSTGPGRRRPTSS